MNGDSQQETVSSVLEGYDLGALQGVARHGGTAAGNWRVETAGGVWLLRTRGARTCSAEAIAFDHALRRHLLSRAVPTAAPVARRDGQTFTRLEDRVYEVYPFVSGFSAGAASTVQLQSAARGLADFHRAAATFRQGRAAPLLAQYATVGVPDETERPEDPALLTRGYEQLSSQAGRGRFAEAADYCLRWLRRLREQFGSATYSGLPHVLTHGDYTLANLLFDKGGGLAGIFDFDWARRAPRVRDLADGMYFVGALRRTPLSPGDIWSLTETADFILDRCVLWLRAYGQVERLMPDEIHVLPLAFAARWLSVRIEGTAKVAAKDRVRFCFRDVAAPLEWLETHWPQVEARLERKPR